MTKISLGVLPVGFDFIQKIVQRKLEEFPLRSYVILFSHGFILEDVVRSLNEFGSDSLTDYDSLHE